MGRAEDGAVTAVSDPDGQTYTDGDTMSHGARRSETGASAVLAAGGRVNGA